MGQSYPSLTTFQRTSIPLYSLMLCGIPLLPSKGLARLGKRISKLTKKITGRGRGRGRGRGKTLPRTPTRPQTRPRSARIYRVPTINIPRTHTGSSFSSKRPPQVYRYGLPPVPPSTPVDTLTARAGSDEPSEVVEGSVKECIATSSSKTTLDDTRVVAPTLVDSPAVDDGPTSQAISIPAPEVVTSVTDSVLESEVLSTCPATPIMAAAIPLPPSPVIEPVEELAPPSPLVQISTPLPTSFSTPKTPKTKEKPIATEAIHSVVNPAPPQVEPFTTPPKATHEDVNHIESPVNPSTHAEDVMEPDIFDLPPMRRIDSYLSLASSVSTFLDEKPRKWTFADLWS